MSSKNFNKRASLYTECGKTLNDLVNTMTQCHMDDEGDPLQGYYDDNGHPGTEARHLEILRDVLNEDSNIGGTYVTNILELLQKHAGSRVEGIKADYKAYTADFMKACHQHEQLLNAVPELKEAHVDFYTWFAARRAAVDAARAARNDSFTHR